MYSQLNHQVLSHHVVVQPTLRYTSAVVNILALSDIHNSVSSIHSLGSPLEDADLVLLTGDLTHFGGKKEAAVIVDAVRSYNSNVLAVSGNCDQSQVESYLRDEGISLHGDAVVRESTFFVGLGGSLPAPGRTPNELSEEEITRLLKGAMNRLESVRKEAEVSQPLILVSHQPPKDTVADRIFTGNHVGSMSVRSFIERWRPLVCFTGHIHEGRGTDAIGHTLVVNPGPAGNNYFALVDTSKNPIYVSLGEIPE